MKREIDEYTFETRVSAPSPDGMQEKAFTVAARLCRESWMVPHGARACLLFEGKPGAGGDLAAKMRKAYAEMVNHPDMERMLNGRTFGHTLSAKENPGHGHYYLRHVPGAPTVVFLHGYGGNFLFYLWMLKRLLPNCTTVHPSCGIDWLKRSAAENRECISDLLDDLQRRTDASLANVWLAGVSDGGVAAFEIAGQCPERFRGLISIASAPDPKTLQVHGLPRGYPVLMINGMDDDRFPIEVCRARASLLLQGGAELRFLIIDQASHFFLLSCPEKMESTLRSFLTSPDQA